MSDVVDAFDLLNERQIELVDLVFSDITGGAKTLTIPLTQLPGAFDHGYRFDGSAVMGGDRSVEIDLLLAPDPQTIMIMPCYGDAPRRARIACSVIRRDRLPFDGDPRAILKRTVETAGAMGIDYRIGIEIEFYLVRGDLGVPDPAVDPAGYFDVGEDAVSRARDLILISLQSIGISVGGAHHETGPGQEELDLVASGAIEMADRLITVRHIVRSVAQKYDLRATFMPKPFPEAPGSGMHVFQHFRSQVDQRDLLVDPEGGLSGFAYQVIGGQLAHALGMSAVLCPTVNSYKRLNAGHRAPRYASWAHVSQASMIRVPSQSERESAAIELRSPDAMANPYLALSVALAAAIDGLRQELEPPDPLEESFSRYEAEEYQRFGIPRLPGTLGEALQMLSQDDTVRNALGDYISDQLISVKQDEWEEYRAHVSPWEHLRYGDA